MVLRSVGCHLCCWGAAGIRTEFVLCGPMGNHWRSLGLLSWVQVATTVLGGWLWSIAALW